MIILKKLYPFILIVWLAGITSCNKDFLDAKPDTDLFIPTTLDDFQVLLDNDNIMNETPVLGELSADNFYLPYTFWAGLNNIKEKNAYRWLPETFSGLSGEILDWNVPYKQVFYTNVILEGLDKIAVTPANQEKWKAIKGAALFARAYAFYNVAQVFAPVYDYNTAASDLGIPLRLQSGIDERSVRANCQETYDRILADLKESAGLLAVTVPLNNNRNRPCKQAAFAMLGRVYLSMSIYSQAKLYADSCINLYDSLIDYNSAAITTNAPFTTLNSETLYQSRFFRQTNVLRGVSIKSCIVDSTLYNSYAPDDLRRSAFFTQTALPNPKASYTGTTALFTGLATDEVYLIRAECQARAGNTLEAMNDLNT
jgi:hypothetical protein